MNVAQKQETADKISQFYPILTQKLSDLAEQALLLPNFLQALSKALIDFFDCNRIEFLLLEDARLQASFYVQNGSPQFHLETLKAKSANTLKSTISRTIDLDQLKLLLLHAGEDKLESVHITSYGAFWAENLARPIQFFHTNSESGRTRSLDFNPPRKKGSCLLLPIIIGRKHIGILHLEVGKRGHFNADAVELFEGLASLISIAIAYRHAQIHLRERIKELTCVYQIAKLATVLDAALEETLTEAVNMIPPAFLYPEAAFGVIQVDDQNYTSHVDRECKHRLQAPIWVHGQERGFVALCYDRDLRVLDQGPFLREEVSLLEAIAQELAFLIERKQVEREKARLNDQIRHADRLATIGQLTAGVAHELNEPLGSILGFAQLIQKQTDLPIGITSDIERIIKASLHARTIVQKLLLFSRQMPPVKSRINLNELIREALYLFAKRLETNQIALTLDFDPAIPGIVADPAQLNQVVVNLVVNAIQAMPNGGELVIHTQRQADQIVLWVQDTGVGMTAKVKDQIFIPFFTTKEVHEGTGLGLPVVLGIVASHGGKIDVESTVGTGAKFTLTLPIKNGQSEGNSHEAL
ncbi:MAG: GAF domain-containing protein [Candidatus Marinimicrobia bacterium]|nr:GAF domain-containing protein [Candidatus Neomarinimicrobiota bacterium]MCF7839454.1 GAF domain-containing protein [Candidatus Neomarinimicrobiota bacterium]MCF7901870.1 GAF domain-containing protein [Candidatus Neomarinimicrobiota bacterium]